MAEQTFSQGVDEGKQSRTQLTEKIKKIQDLHELINLSINALNLMSDDAIGSTGGATELKGFDTDAYIQQLERTLVALGTATEQLSKKRDAPRVDPGPETGFYTPLVRSNALYAITYPDRHLLCFNLGTGKIQWRMQLSADYYSIYFASPGLIVVGDRIYSVHNPEAGELLYSGSLVGSFQGMGGDGSLFVCSESDHSLAVHKIGENKVVGRISNVFGGPVMVTEKLLFCVAQHEKTIKNSDTKNLAVDITSAKYALHCFELATCSKLWEQQLDYQLDGDIGHTIPCKEKRGQLLLKLGNSVILCDAQSGAIIGCRRRDSSSQPSGQSMTVQDILFADNGEGVIVSGEPSYPAYSSTNQYTIQIVDLPSLRTITHFPAPQFGEDPLVIGNILYSGSIAVDIVQKKVINAQRIIPEENSLGGFSVPSYDGWLYYAGGRKYPKNGQTSRYLSRLKMGTTNYGTS
jgi:hypothetical protein